MASIDELWVVDLGDPYPGKPASHRPALVVGPPESPSYVSVCDSASAHYHSRGLSLHVEVEANSAIGLSETSYIQCELIRTVNRNRLLRRLGAVDGTTSHHVTTIIRTLLNLQSTRSRPTRRSGWWPIRARTHAPLDRGRHRGGARVPRCGRGR
ncbi:MAG: type II toxin-antitoxin system PemK/MazF family toxin [Acidimicrobiia bacterium]